MLVESLLDQARTAGKRFADAEQRALLARADYHTAIRRLHLGGASLREIAQALALSHQRVQQVVNAAGGSWWQFWRARRVKPDAVCSWCNRSPAEVAKLVAGPNVFICDACVAESEQAIAAAEGRHRCDFCRKTAKASRRVLAGPPNICADCLRICREIIDSADTTAT